MQKLPQCLSVILQIHTNVIIISQINSNKSSLNETQGLGYGGNGGLYFLQIRLNSPQDVNNTDGKQR